MKKVISMCMILSIIGFLHLSQGKITTESFQYDISCDIGEFSSKAYTINGDDYVRLKDFEKSLRYTSKMFNFEWDYTSNVINIKSGKKYECNYLDEECKDISSAKVTPHKLDHIFIDGLKTDCIAYSVENEIYLKLTDISKVLDINVEVNPSILELELSGFKKIPYGYYLTLVADQKEALLNGERVHLPAAPFVQEGTFYIPLEATANLLNGVYSFENNVATVKLSGNVVQYEIGSVNSKVNGTNYAVKDYYCEFYKPKTITNAEVYVPQSIDGVVFIPINFLSSLREKINVNLDLDCFEAYPDENLVILDLLFNSNGTEDVLLYDRYDDLAKDFRSELKFAGVVDNVLNYAVEEYSNDDIHVYVLRLESLEDIEEMDGKVCSIYMTGSRYQTASGLKPGDSEYKCSLLYPLFRGDFYACNIVNHKVESIIFNSRYYGSQYQA